MSRPAVEQSASIRRAIASQRLAGGRLDPAGSIVQALAPRQSWDFPSPPCGRPADRQSSGGLSSGSIGRAIASQRLAHGFGLAPGHSLGRLAHAPSGLSSASASIRRASRAPRSGQARRLPQRLAHGLGWQPGSSPSAFRASAVTGFPRAALRPSGAPVERLDPPGSPKPASELASARRSAVRPSSPHPIGHRAPFLKSVSASWPKPGDAYLLCQEISGLAGA